MAVNPTFQDRIVSIKFDLGLDPETQRTKTKTKSYSAIKQASTQDDVHAVATVLASLQEYDVLSITDIVKTELSA
ncbi:MAG: DUF1659 domain-containing protein [Paraclostridium sp.]